MKKYFSWLIVLVLIFSFTSCARIEGLVDRFLQEPEKEYTIQDTLIITLPATFEEKDMTHLGFSKFLASPTAVMLFAMVAAPDGYATPLEYGTYLADHDRAPNGVQHDEKNGLVYYVYSNPHLGTSVRYVYLHDGMFWLIDISNGSDTVEDQLPKYEKWAKSVTFVEAD